MTWRGFRKVYAFTAGMVSLHWLALAGKTTPTVEAAITAMVGMLIGGNVAKAYIQAKNGNGR